MNPLNDAALNKARDLIKQTFDDLSDLPIEVRNTIANIYYEYSLTLLKLKSDSPLPESISRSNDLKSGFQNFIKDSAELISSVETIPKVISAIRNVSRKGNKKSFDLFVLTFLYMYKYKIPNVTNKSLFRLKIEKFFSPKVNEIEHLWKML